MNVDKAFEKYSEYLQNLSLASLGDLRYYVDRDVVFSDPFHQEKGIANMTRILNKMFEKVTDVQFKILDHAVNDHTVYFNWQLIGVLSKKSWSVEGVTMLIFDDELKVTHHLEHWDAASQFYERLPIIGRLLKYVRGQISR